MLLTNCLLVEQFARSGSLQSLAPLATVSVQIIQFVTPAVFQLTARYLRPLGFRKNSVPYRRNKGWFPWNMYWPLPC